MTFWKRWDYGDSKKVSCYQARGVEKNEQAEHGGFLWQWKYSAWYYNGGDTSWYISLNPQDVQYQQCKLQTLVDTDVSGRTIHRDRCPILWGMWTMGRCCQWWRMLTMGRLCMVEAGDIREISALSLCCSEGKSAPIKLSVLSKAKTKPTTTPSRCSGYTPSDSDYLHPMVLKWELANGVGWMGTEISLAVSWAQRARWVKGSSNGKGSHC